MDEQLHGLLAEFVLLAEQLHDQLLHIHAVKAAAVRVVDLKRVFGFDVIGRRLGEDGEHVEHVFEAHHVRAAGEDVEYATFERIDLL